MRRDDVRIKLFRGHFYAYWRENGTTRRASLRAADRDAAERNLIDWLRAQAGPRETVADIMQAYLDDRHGRPNEMRARDAWKRLQPHFGHLRPEHVTRASCREYILKRRGPWNVVKPVNPGRAGGRPAPAKDGTIIKELATLRAALRWHNKATPAVIELPRQPPPRARYLTREEYRALREAAKATPHCHVFIWLAYRTAGRASAILDLTWDRVDFERGMIRLGERVGNKGRATVPMADDLAAVLREAQAAALTDRVVEFRGAPVRSIRKTFAAAVARAGLVDVSPHVLRHSAAVHMAEGGIPMVEIARFLGHSSEAITFKVYAVHSPSYLRRAAGALE